MEVLHEFLAEVYRIDGYNEMQRVMMALFDVREVGELNQGDWTDKTGDGNLKVDPGTGIVMAAGTA